MACPTLLEQLGVRTNQGIPSHELVAKRSYSNHEVTPSTLTWVLKPLPQLLQVSQSGLQLSPVRRCLAVPAAASSAVRGGAAGAGGGGGGRCNSCTLCFLKLLLALFFHTGLQQEHQACITHYTRDCYGQLNTSTHLQGSRQQLQQGAAPHPPLPTGVDPVRVDSQRAARGARDQPLLISFDHLAGVDVAAAGAVNDV